MSFFKGKAAEAASEPFEKDIQVGPAADRQSVASGTSMPSLSYRRILVAAALASGARNSGSKL